MAKSLRQQHDIIPGTYEGRWSAYFAKVRFANGNESPSFKLDEGIRGVNCKCSIVIDKDGWAHVN